jgi:hypothetical protein
MKKDPESKDRRSYDKHSLKPGPEDLFPISTPLFEEVNPAWAKNFPAFTREPADSARKKRDQRNTYYKPQSCIEFFFPKNCLFLVL